MRTFQGNRLKNLRINRGYSLEMTARLLGLKSDHRVTRSAISHWERGHAKPNTEHLLALGETFQVPVDYFFEPLPNYLFGEVRLPHTRRGKPPLPELTMSLEPAMESAGIVAPKPSTEIDCEALLEPEPPRGAGHGTPRNDDDTAAERRS